ncbi:Hsp20/alpha crystallin family protein [Georgenia thermotolerans]|uniref:Hsp20 family protein n=1 Tax=Georgenia thermotolerans TaxID=527326 RepID=A0A7J5UNY4_9MICO|nr:Hsp20/alpha crystallin family protein [Georgenia thermotolerans]KAE8764112.1 Hsp20 family protein [Georgenia thermotolerans]
MATRYDPFREMDRWLSNARQVPATPGMPLDLYRQGEAFVAKVDLPGVDPATIDIDVEDRTLTIRAERRREEAEDLQWLTHERPAGTFARQLSLGQGLALDRIEAGYADGVLTLTIPVAEEAKPRKIQVSHTGRPAGVETGSGEETASV